MVGCKQGSASLQSPFDSIIPYGIKTAPTVTDEFSSVVANLKGTYYTQNTIVAEHTRICTGKGIRCVMIIEVLQNSNNADIFFEEEAQGIKNVCSIGGQQMSSYFTKQKPDDVIFYQLETLPDSEHSKGEVEYGVYFRVGHYVGLYHITVIDPMINPDLLHSSSIYDIGYNNLEAIWSAVDMTIPKLRTLVP